MSKKSKTSFIAKNFLDSNFEENKLWSKNWKKLVVKCNEHGYEKPVSSMSFTDFVSEFCVDFDPMVCSIVMEQFSCDMCMTYKIVVKLT